MSIFDYATTDFLFAHWMKRKREIMEDAAYFKLGYNVPKWMDDRLDALRPTRNQNCSIYILDECYR